MAEEQMPSSDAPRPVPDVQEPYEHASLETSPAATPPIVVELGVRRRRHLEQLARAQGPLMTQVAEVIAEVRRQLAGELTGQTLVPLVMIYRRKGSRRRRSGSKSTRSVAKRGYRVIFPR